MWHGPEAAGDGPLLEVCSRSTTADVSCVGRGTLPLDTGMKLKYDTKLKSLFSGKALSSVIVSAKNLIIGELALQGELVKLPLKASVAYRQNTAVYDAS